MDIFNIRSFRVFTLYPKYLCGEKAVINNKIASHLVKNKYQVFKLCDLCVSAVKKIFKQVSIKLQIIVLFVSSITILK